MRKTNSILIINHYAGSSKMGMEYRHFYLARELVRMGHTVTIVAASFSHLRGNNPLPDHSLQETVENGVSFVWIKTPPYYRNNAYRARNIAAFLSSLRRHAKQLVKDHRPDVVVASSTYLLDIYPAARITKLAGARLVFELHDVWPLTLTELHDYPPRHPLIRVLGAAERASYRLADAVVSILPGAALRARELGITNKKITHVPNGISPENTGACEKSSAQQRIAHLKAQGMFTVVYVGGFAQANALETLVQACSLLPDGIAVVLVGKGERKTELMAFATQKNLRNLYFEEYVQKAQTHGVLTEADCLYLGARASALYRYGIGMNKLYDYMLAAKPIVFGIDAPDNEVCACACGVCVQPQSAEALAEGILHLWAMPSAQRESMGARGREYVLANRTYTALAQQFLDAVL